MEILKIIMACIISPAAILFIMLTAPAIITIIGIIWIGLVALYLYVRQTVNRKAKIYRSAIGLVIIVISSTLPFIGFTKGMTVDMLSQMPYPDIIAATAILPEPSKKLPENETGALYYIYKFSCDDCLKANTSIRDLFNHYNVTPYYVSSRSPQGEQLVQKYSIGNVPSLLYVANSNTNEFYAEVIYANNTFNISSAIELLARYKNK